MANKRLLITGGTGFIGRNLAIRALKNGYDVTSLSRSAPSTGEQIPEVSYIYADVANKDQLSDQLSSNCFEYVVNLSGNIDHKPLENGGQKIYDVHAGGVCNLVDLLNRDSLKKFIQIGSSDEYGNQPAPQHEGLQESPISPYSSGKVASTQFLQKLHASEKFPVVVLRFFLVYGPEQSSERFFPQIIKGCLESKHFPASAGTQLRDFCFIDDISRGILLALDTTDDVDGEVINLASGEPISIRDTIEKVQRTVGSGTPRYGEIPFRKGENKALVADITKAKALLNWNPIISIDEGIRRTVDAYRSPICNGT